MSTNITTACNNKYNSGYNAGLVSATLTMTLLWTNSSPTSSFTPQTISVDLSGYNYAMLDFRATTNSETQVTKYFLIPIGSMLLAGASTAYTTSPIGWSKTYVRCALATSTGVEFSYGFYQSASNNAYAIPLHIYGVK
jgi:hypothetical protein